jgi:hypothetical protein
VTRAVALLAGLALALLLLPAGAQAATVSVSTVGVQMFEPHTGDFTVIQSTFTYTAAAGEANAPALTFTADHRVLTIQDPGAVIAAGTGCAPGVAGEVRCEVPPGSTPVSVKLALGDGDDVLAPFAGAPPGFPAIDAGPGADTVDVVSGTVEGGEGDDVLRGSVGPATLKGGPGADTITGGSAEDAVYGGPGADRLDGGAGRDFVYFDEAQAPVTVDLTQPGPAGTAAEPDDIRNFEGAAGGAGADLLRGDDGDNFFIGGGGDDLIEGRGGNDTIDVGPGADRALGGDGNDELVNGVFVAAGEADTLEGGAGDDVLRDLSTGAVLLGGPGADTLDFQQGARRADGGAGNDRIAAFELRGSSVFIRCGAGSRDVISGLRAATLVPPDCELIAVDRFEDARVRARVRLRGSRLIVPIADICASSTCRMTITVRVAGRTVAARVRRLRTRVGRTLTIRLSPAARRRVAAAARVRVDYRAREALRPFAMTVRPTRG